MLDLTTITLTKGLHKNFESGACLLEAASYLAGEKWTDHPTCVSKVLGTFGRSLNDILPDGLRKKLVQLIAQIVGTADDGQDEARSFMALDWLIRTHTPTFLELAKLTDEANSLRALDPIVDMETVALAGPVVRTARVAAGAAGAAAGVAGAAWAAAGAARDAAWAAAGAAEATAGAAAEAAAEAAARAAAGAYLQPTVDFLQESAIDLFTRMINPAASNV